MPDINKLQKLQEIGYKIRVSCNSCKFFQKGTIQDTAWGICLKHQYEHLKHTVTRNCSVRAEGWCPQFELGPNKFKDLGAHKEFLKIKED